MLVELCVVLGTEYVQTKTFARRSRSLEQAFRCRSVTAGVIVFESWASNFGSILKIQREKWLAISSVLLVAEHFPLMFKKLLHLSNHKRIAANMPFNRIDGVMRKQCLILTKVTKNDSKDEFYYSFCKNLIEHEHQWVAQATYVNGNKHYSSFSYATFH